MNTSRQQGVQLRHFEDSLCSALKDFIAYGTFLVIKCTSSVKSFTQNILLINMPLVSWPNPTARACMLNNT